MGQWRILGREEKLDNDPTKLCLSAGLILTAARCSLSSLQRVFSLDPPMLTGLRENEATHEAHFYSNSCSNLLSVSKIDTIHLLFISCTYPYRS